MKKLIIDGHNLIPKLPGLHLKDMDDEVRLIERIQEYCRLTRKLAELFFDGSLLPQANIRKQGLVNVHFIKAGFTADNAIIQYVRDHAKAVDTLMVVSSDHRIQNAVRAVNCEVISSEIFAKMMNNAFASDTAVQQRRNKPLSDAEIEEWLEFFEQEKNS